MTEITVNRVLAKKEYLCMVIGGIFLTNNNRLEFDEDRIAMMTNFDSQEQFTMNRYTNPIVFSRKKLIRVFTHPIPQEGFFARLRKFDFGGNFGEKEKYFHYLLWIFFILLIIGFMAFFMFLYIFFTIAGAIRRVTTKCVSKIHYRIDWHDLGEKFNKIRI
jgi:hypothetical protein